MAMAVALAGSSVGAATGLRSVNKALGSGVQGLKPVSVSLRKVAALKKQLPGICGKLGVVEKSNVCVSVEKAMAGALFAALASSDSALAVQQLDSLAAAADDSRALALLVPLVPAVLWVLYNILQPGLNQLSKMRASKGLVGAVGLGAFASLIVPPSAEAVQELASIAEGDQRGFLLLGVLAAAIGWVLYNILQPGLNQLNKMRSGKGLVGALGLSAAAASLLPTPAADAAQELGQLAEGDQRGLLLLGVLALAIGWVLFNILQPALNQLNKMRSGK